MRAPHSMVFKRRPRLLRLRALLDLTQSSLASRGTHLGLLVTLLLDQLKRGADHGLGRGLADLPLGLLLGVLQSALLVHPAVQKRPRDLPGVELLVEVRLRLPVDEQEGLGVATHILDAVTGVDAESAVRADLRLDNHGDLRNQTVQVRGLSAEARRASQGAASVC